MQEKVSFVYYQDAFFYYFWKSSGIASSRGKSISFLDILCDEDKNYEVRNIVKSQMEFFGKEKELGLLNRLDGATTGLLYFAKNPNIYAKFRELQKNEKIDKFYIAQVYGNISYWVEKFGNIINYPIMHHRFSDNRMIVIRTKDDEKKGKGNIHIVKTEICESQFIQSENRSIVMVKIHKGIRHQIRAHLSSIGYPICGDHIYCKGKAEEFDKLQLFSVGMKIDNF